MSGRSAGSYPPLDLAKGDWVLLVRWFMRRDEWTYEGFRGRYVSRTDEVWRVEVPDGFREFPRDVWKVCEE